MRNLRLPILIVLLIMSIGGSVFAAEFTDIDGHWAEDEIVKWSNNGLIKGYEGKFNPDSTITRGEMAIMLDRLFDYQLSAENSFTDLPDDWYTEAILKNNEKGIILGYEGQARPLDKITRQEAIVMLGKAFNIDLVDKEATYTDAMTIGSWALPYVNGMEAAGYISAKADGGLYPNEAISRAEIVAIIDRVVGAYYNKSGQYTGDVDGLVLVNTKDVVLSNMKISGDLIVAEGVADGDLTLNSVDVKGEMHVFGGGENSIKLYDTTIGKVILSKKASKVRLYSDGKIEEIVVSKDTIVVIDGDVSVDDIVINDNSDIEIRKDVKVSTVKLNGEGVKAVFNGRISTLNVAKDPTNSEIKGSGEITTVNKSVATSSNGGSSQSNTNVDSVSSASKSTSSSTTKKKDKKDKKDKETEVVTPDKDDDKTTVTDNNSYTLKPSFMAAPTVDVTVSYNKSSQKGYTLYVGGKIAGVDSDNDGVLTTINNYFDSSAVVEFSPKGSSTKYVLKKNE